MPTHTPAAEVVLRRIEALRAEKARVIVAIDGRCASGKTTLASVLSETLACPVIHMDHFFLRPHMRTPERLATPGGNIDKERFYEEVMVPLSQGRAFAYRPFDCHTGGLTEPIRVPSSAVAVVEGSYSLCDELWPHYDLRVFLTVPPPLQLQRIERRNGPAQAEVFRRRWIPMEEAYFEAFRIKERCHLVLDTADDE